MTWIMAGLFLISLIMMARMQPKIEGQKAAGIEDFQFPSAAERPIQVVFGTRKVSGPNVLWYGDLQARPIYEKIKTLFSTKKTVVGHRYYMGMQLGVCHGEDAELKAVYFADDLAWSGSVGGMYGESFEINKPDLFGGPEGGGGASGKVTFYSGNRYQNACDYLISKLGASLVSPLRGLAYAVFEGFYIGNSASPAAISFVVSRMPKGPKSNLVTSIGDDANPAYIIYELLTDRKFGAAIPKSLIDGQSFIDAAHVLQTENFGLSLVIDSASSAGQVISELQKVIQASLVDDPKTGKIMLKLVRSDYDPADLFEINESNIRSVSDYTSGSLDTAINEVRVKFLAREFDYKERTAIAQNNGVRVHKGDVETKTISMPQISNSSIAAKVAQRELVASSSPMKTCTVECTRALSNVLVGDVLKMSWKILGIEQQIMRVTSVDLGRPGDGAIRMTLAQDVFGVFNSVYANTESGWEKPSFEPVSVSDYLVIDAPAILAEGMTSANLVLAKRTASAMDYKLMVKRAVDESYIDAGIHQFTAVFALSESLAAGNYSKQTLTISGDSSDLEPFTSDEAYQGMGLYLIDSAAGREWICCSGIKVIDASTVALQNVKRGLFDSTPVAHANGSKIWAVGDGHGVARVSFAAGSAADMKLLVKTLTRRQTESESPVLTAPHTGHNQKPWRPGFVKVNGQDGGAISGEATITWKTRDGSGTKIVHYDDAISQSTDAVYSISVKTPEKYLHTEEDIDAETWTFSNEKETTGRWETNEQNQLVFIPGDYAPELTFEIVAKKGSAVSEMISITVNRN